MIIQKNNKYLEYVIPLIGLGYIIFLLNKKKLLQILIFILFIILAGLKETSLNLSILFSLIVCLFLFHYHDYLPHRIENENQNEEEGFRLSSNRKRHVYYDDIDSPWFNRKDEYGPDTPDAEFGDFDEDEGFNYLEPFATQSKSKRKIPKILSKEEKDKIRTRLKSIKEHRQRKKHLKEEEKKMYSNLPPKYYKNLNDIFKTKTRSLNESFRKHDKLKENFYMIVNS